MPYPPGVNDVPDYDSDYCCYIAEGLQDATADVTPPDGLHIEVDVDAVPYSQDNSYLNVKFTAWMYVPNYPDAADASLDMVLTLAAYWAAVGADMSKARRK